MKTIRLPKPADPLQSEIDRRLAIKRGKESVRPAPAPVVGTEALRDAAAFLRAHPVAVVVMEVHHGR